MDGYAFLLCADQFEITVRQAIAGKVSSDRARRDSDLSIMIVNNLMTALGLDKT